MPTDAANGDRRWADRAASLYDESYARRYPKNWFNFFPYWEQG